MANIPGMPGVLPGVFGPSGTEMIKTERGYAFGWTNSQVWGNPHIDGSCKEIARDIIIRYSKVLSFHQENGSNWYHTNMDHVSFYGAIYIKWKPKLTVSLYDHLQISKDIDKQIFIDEMTVQLKLLEKLLPFV